MSRRRRNGGGRGEGGGRSPAVAAAPETRCNLQNPKYLLSGSLQKMFANPGLSITVNAKGANI